MRIRVPKKDTEQPEIKELEEKIKKTHQQSVTYTLKVITPIYGGGVKAGEPDMEMPIRASAIRGQLRYWWRFLKMNAPGNRVNHTFNKRDSMQEVFKEERKIWGGMGDGEDNVYSSKVFINVKCKPINNNDLIEAKSLIGRNGIGYALFSTVQGDDNHKLIKNGYTFELSISSSDLEDHVWKSVLESMRWWICFGGIGARTRRGLGSLEVINTTDKAFFMLTEADVNKYCCEIKTIDASDALDAWNKAVGKLHHFRQVEFQYKGDPNIDHRILGVGRKIKNEQRHRDNIEKSYPSRSHWPEPDSIREIVSNNTRGHDPIHPAKQSFPRAAFGLPIIFDFVNDAPPEKTELIPVLSDDDSNNARMSSPLVLKAMKINNSYKAVALRMPCFHLESLSIRLKNASNSNNRNLPADFTNGSWWSPVKAKNVKPINDQNGTDALSAFMNYFTKGEK
jgi:CRISPR-associated protein Cmr1